MAKKNVSLNVSAPTAIVGSGLLLIGVWRMIKFALYFADTTTVALKASWNEEPCDITKLANDKFEEHYGI